MDKTESLDRYCDKMGISIKTLFIAAYTDPSSAMNAFRYWQKTGEDDPIVRAYLKRVQKI